MLSRRRFLVGSSLLGLASGGHAQTPDGFIELRAGPNGFGGSAPGPVIRVRRGAEVRARFINELDEPSAIHWHGVRLPNPMDGAPPLTQKAVARGASFDYRFVAPDAGTFWYHAATGDPQKRGLYGALVVEDSAPAPADRDHLLIWSGGTGGPDTVNGMTALDLATRTNARLRLRFINVSTGSVMRARIPGDRALVMALDGQPAEPFGPRDNVIILGPGNRADVFWDSSQAQGSAAPIAFAADAGAAPTVRLVTENAPPVRQAPLAAPVPLAANPLPERISMTRALRATLRIGGDARPARGGAANDKDAPLFVAERGRTVMIAAENQAGAQAVHVHGHSFRLLDRLDDGWKPYWLDTLLMPERQTARIAFVADNPGRWLIAWQPLGRIAGGTAWFQVN